MMKMEKAIVYFSLSSDMKIPNYVVPDNVQQTDTKPCYRIVLSAMHT